ncbi:MAG: zf-HC2 domain-containing protein, partial [Armatimonadetes bacterium]|nr:zf-HC2 domain-containing protein [Armatimonadota bacterium]
MNCEKVRDVLIDYVKEELDEDTQKRVEEHLM